MGEVYRARDTKLNRDVALKTLPATLAADPDYLARFKRESQLLASLNHANIAAVYGFEDADNVHAIAMELVEGEDLAERIARGPIPVGEALAIARQLADALEAAHEHGIIHRDLKPANIKLRPDGTVKVLDFGLAKALDPTTARSGISAMVSPTLSIHATQAGVILGTAAYMSPEQARGRVVDRRADIWAFGAVLYEMLTGRRAFDGETVSDSLAYVITKEPNWAVLPASIPSGLRRLLARCLTKDPRMRLRDIGEARVAIDELGRIPADEESPATIPPRSLPAWRRAVPWVVALVGSLAAAAAWLPSPAPAPAPVRRFSVQLPRGQSLQTGRSFDLVLSPDGNTIVASGLPGTGSLVRRRLDSLEFETIPGTEGGSAPFFSPDGAWMAFFANGELKRAPVNGGLASTICKATGRGSWGDDDTIAFADGANLYTVTANGGTPRIVAKAEGTDSLSFPQMIPRSRALLFQRFTRGQYDDTSRIEVVHLETGVSQVLLEGSNPQVAPGGELLFSRRGGLWAVPLDAERLAVTGTPVPLVASLRGLGPGSVYSLARDGSLAYMPGGSADASLVWIDRTGKTTPALTARGSFQSPRLSPDATRVVVSVLEEPNGTDLWMYEFARGTRLRVTTNGRSRRTVWSPDGQRLAFYSTQIGDQDLFVVPTVGGEPARLLERPQAQYPSSWSPDGRFLLFEEVEAATMRRDIWVLPADEAPKPVIVTGFYERGAVFSPDGRHIAYVSDESGRSEVYVQPFPGPGPKVTVSSNGGLQPVWSRDGKELFYREDDWLVAAAVQPSPFRVLSAQRLAELPADLYNLDVNFPDYDVAPDGRFIAVRRENFSGDAIHVVLNWTTELAKALGR